MTEQDILGRIEELVSWENDLRARAVSGDLDPATERNRLADLEVMLDQCWDLLRRRRASLDAGTPPDEASAGSPGQVEGYLQ